MERKEVIVRLTKCRETRILRRLTMQDAKEMKQAAEMFDVLMGSNVENRRNYLVKNSTLFDREALDV